MSPLEQIIIDKIKKQGPVTFEVFMDMALYYPDLGYYSSPGATIGRHGDFYTSPHLHPIFGAMIGKQLMEMWAVMGKPSEFRAVEIGAGAGYLCKDILDYLHKPSQDTALSQDKNDFLNSLRYVIVEPYSHFEERQRELLNQKHFSGNPRAERRPHTSPVEWVNSLRELKEIEGCIFSNELLDAFPVHIVEMEEELKEIYVAFDGKEFREEKNKISSKEIMNYINQFSIELQPGYRTEINLRIRNWLEEIDATLSRAFF